jgi:deoxyribonuclease-4
LESSAVSRRLGVCLDTCHALAAGYDLRERTGFRKTFRDFDRTIGIDRLKAFHLNDSRHPLGSRRDRHEHIGRGEVGVEGFRLILNDRRFRGLPMVLETPKGEDEAEDVNNLARLRDLLPRSRR